MQPQHKRHIQIQVIQNIGHAIIMNTNNTEEQKNAYTQRGMPGITWPHGTDESILCSYYLILLVLTPVSTRRTRPSYAPPFPTVHFLQLSESVLNSLEINCLPHFQSKELTV